MENFSKALEIQPEMTSIRFDYGNLLADNGQTDEALTQYEEYIKTNKDNDAAYLNAGILYSQKTDYTNAQRILEQGRTLSPKNIEIQKELAKAYHLDKKYDKAIEIYDVLLASMPDDRDLLLNKAVAYHAQKKYSEAIEIYKSILTKDSSDKKVFDYLLKAYIAQGDTLYGEGNYRKAVSSYESALKMDGENSLLYINIANAYDKLGSKSKVTEYYEKALEISPDNAELLSSYAKMLTKYDKNDDARIVYEKAMASPSATSEDRYNYYVDMADSYYKAKDYENAQIGRAHD